MTKSTILTAPSSALEIWSAGLDMISKIWPLRYNVLVYMVCGNEGTTVCSCVPSSDSLGTICHLYHSRFVHIPAEDKMQFLVLLQSVCSPTFTCSDILMTNAATSASE